MRNKLNKYYVILAVCIPLLLYGLFSLLRMKFTPFSDVLLMLSSLSFLLAVPTIATIHSIVMLSSNRLLQSNLQLIKGILLLIMSGLIVLPVLVNGPGSTGIADFFTPTWLFVSLLPILAYTSAGVVYIVKFYLKKRQSKDTPACKI